MNPSPRLFFLDPTTTQAAVVHFVCTLRAAAGALGRLGVAGWGREIREYADNRRQKKSVQCCPVYKKIKAKAYHLY